MSDREVAEDSFESLEKSEDPTESNIFENLRKQEWKLKARAEYEKICKEFKAKEAPEIKNLLDENWKKIEANFEAPKFLRRKFSPRRSKSRKFSPPALAPVPSTAAAAEKVENFSAGEENFEDEEKKPKMRRSEGSKFVPLLSVKELPIMDVWESISRNFYTDDEMMLSNYPWMGDEMQDDDLAEELRNSYDRGVHGAPRPSPYINERIFIELMDRLLPQLPEEERKIGDDGELVVPEFLLNAIAAEFHDYGGERDLREKYSDVCRKRRQDGPKVHQTNPNIDGPDAVSTTRDRALHSYSSLFCIRCFRYDCFIHTPVQNAHGTLTFRRKAGDLLPPTEACGPNCFLNHLKELESLKAADDLRSSPRVKRPRTSSKTGSGINSGMGSGLNSGLNSGMGSGINSGLGSGTEFSDSDDQTTRKISKLQIAIENDHWTGKEETLCRVFMPIYKKHFCAISQIIGTKTCRQVYLFCLREKSASLSPSSAPSSPAPPRRKQREWALQYNKVCAMKRANQEDGKISTSAAFIPCSGHPGKDCKIVECNCAKRGNFCEKFCDCSPMCQNRFPGCRCKSGCFSKHCPCWLAVRECDPDLCTTCGATEIPENLPLSSILSGAGAQDGVQDGAHKEPVSNHDIAPASSHGAAHSTPNHGAVHSAPSHGASGAQIVACKNCSIQRGYKKRLRVAPSDMPGSGWGCFVQDPVEKNELISEYCGEILTQEEAERRGKVYDRQKLSFLFNLNQEFVCDATRKGNMIRFANHSDHPNCHAKVMMVMGDHRIGVFALRPLKAGEELFFDYRYGHSDHLKLVNVIIEKEQQRKQRGKRVENSSESKSKSKAEPESESPQGAPLAPHQKKAPNEKKIRKRKIGVKIIGKAKVGRKPGPRALAGVGVRKGATAVARNAAAARRQLAALSVRRRNLKAKNPKIAAKRILQKFRRISPRKWKKNSKANGPGPNSGPGPSSGPKSGPGPSGLKKEN